MTFTKSSEITLSTPELVNPRANEIVNEPDQSSKEATRVTAWLRARFEEHPYIYFGVSGTTLLHEALSGEERRTVVLPAFICPFISEAMRAARKRVIHIDADLRTQLPELSQLEACLAAQHPRTTAVLIDHSFGYPFSGIARLRRRFPELLIIEDCARALGVTTDGKAAGRHSDWILLSMYKTVQGCRNGAVLLSRVPLRMSKRQSQSTTLRERIATNATLRSVYNWSQRYANFSSSPMPGALGQYPRWTPVYGVPNRLCFGRFAAELEGLEKWLTIGRSIAQELTEQLCANGVDCIRPENGQQLTGHFVSFRVGQRETRDYIAAKLGKKGLFLGRTWNVVPARFPGFRDTFPAGHGNSEYLADHMLHIRVRLYSSARSRKRLVEELHKVDA